MELRIRKPQSKIRALIVAVCLALLEPFERWGRRNLCLYASTTIESQGVSFKVSDGGSPSSYSTVANVVSLKGPGGSASVIDITNLASTAKEKRMGLPDEGQLTVELNYDPDNATHQTLRNARRGRTRLEFNIVLTDTAPVTTLQFYGYVLGFELSAAVDQVVKASVTIEIDGAVSEG